VATQHERWLRALEAELAGIGVTHESIPPEETNTIVRRWRETFAARVYETTGQWVHAGFDWHAFSSGIAYAIDGQAAEHAYREAWAKLKPPGIPRPYYLVAQSALSGEQVAYRCRSLEPPHLGDRDELVTPLDFSWTMAFTHEQGWIGPFFTAPAWARMAPLQQTEQPTNRRSPKRRRK
jgi:hypothetical protein